MSEENEPSQWTAIRQIRILQNRKSFDWMALWRQAESRIRLPVIDRKGSVESYEAGFRSMPVLTLAFLPGGANVCK